MVLYEHDEETNPNSEPYRSRAARDRRAGPRSPRWRSTLRRPPAIAKPITSAHHVIHAIAAVVAAWRALSTKDVPSGFVVVNTPVATVTSAMTARIAYSFRSIWPP